MDLRLALRFGARGGGLALAGIPGAGELMGHLVLLVNSGAELLRVGALRGQLGLQGRDALDVSLVGALDALDVDVVLVEGRHR